ncbi:hypothetical protein P7K49_026982 [Saguinus oedipus]|uniref:Uncharacterized protein n=1 Tax=Saguinus oedipus TaxID=9490 RepID=A0ABQ9UEZ6_SAGOE|nr:hypothetical protein P7K49_026982 [Saguinus oedipus]
MANDAIATTVQSGIEIGTKVSITLCARATVWQDTNQPPGGNIDPSDLFREGRNVTKNVKFQEIEKNVYGDILNSAD